MEKEIKDNETIGLKTIVVRYLHQWKLFLVVFILSFIPAVLYLTFYPRTYEFKARVQIQEDKDGGMAGLGLGEAAGLMKSFGLGGGIGGSVRIDDEISILSSNNIFRQMVLDLGIYAEYTKPYSFYKMYHHESPLILIPDSITLATLDEEYNFSVSVNPDEIKIQVHSDTQKKQTFTCASLPAKITIGAYNFTLDHNRNGNEADKNFQLKIRCIPPSWQADDLIDGFLIEDYSKSSNIIEITCSDHVKERGKAMLNTLIQKYNVDAKTFKSREDSKILDFIKERIDNVMAELHEVESKIETYKTKNGLTLLETDVLFYAEQMKELQITIIELEAQSHVIDMMDDYAKDPANKYNVIPSLLTVEGEKGGAITVYNEALIERNRLLENSNEYNPAFKSMNNQVDKLRDGIFQMIENAKKSNQITLADLKFKEKQLLDKMKSVPTQEREYFDYKRQQEILQGIYLILLQKQEETAISSGQQTDRARMVDTAFVLKKTIAPRKLYAAIGIFILTILIPVFLLWVKDLIKSLKDEFIRTKK
jgi:uncharacterized protein involved in exopolysaccharide biosynthesis